MAKKRKFKKGSIVCDFCEKSRAYFELKNDAGEWVGCVCVECSIENLNQTIDQKDAEIARLEKIIIDAVIGGMATNGGVE